MIQGHGGNIRTAAEKLGCCPDEIRDMSSNINPLGCVPGLIEHLEKNLRSIMSLPEVDASRAVQKMASILDLTGDRVLMGTGTTQFIYTVCPALQIDKALIVGPTYSDYQSSCLMHNRTPSYFIAGPDENFIVNCDKLAEEARAFDVVFLCNVNNPTGHVIDHEQLADVCRQLPGTVFVIDESYLPFAPGEQDTSMAVLGLENVVVLWSLSKIFGTPGLRAGFLVANSPLLDKFKCYMQPWCANSLAQEAVGFLAAHKQQVQAFVQDTKQYLEQERSAMQQYLQHSAATLYPSAAPYQLIRLPGNLTASFVWEEMLKRKILIRDCSNFHGLSDKYIRISLKTQEINKDAAESLLQIITS